MTALKSKAEFEKCSVGILPTYVYEVPGTLNNMLFKTPLTIRHKLFQHCCFVPFMFFVVKQIMCWQDANTTVHPRSSAVSTIFPGVL
jgi:hypothetical protein